MKYSIKHFKFLSKDRTEAECKKLKIPIYILLNKGLISRKINNKKDFVIPDGVPIWAKKYKFTRKRYGIKDNSTKETCYKINPKGVRFCRNLIKLSKNKDKETEEVDEIDDGLNEVELDS
jgi:hypothetical protein